MTRPILLTIAAVALTALLGLAAFRSGGDAPADGDAFASEITLPEIVGQEVAVLTEAPNVPPPITRDHATRVVVEMETVELTKELADGVEYTFWTFGGDVPG